MEKVKKLTKQDWRLLQKVFPETCKGEFDKESYETFHVIRLKQDRNQKDYPIIVFNLTGTNAYIAYIYVPEHKRSSNIPILQEKTSLSLLTHCYDYIAQECNKYVIYTSNEAAFRVYCNIRYPNINSLKFFLNQGFKVTDIMIYPNGTPGYTLGIKKILK